MCKNVENLNRKLSVIALSGMAVFGGVAASAVPAFAAQPKVKVEQQAQDKVEELQELIEKLGYDRIYKAVRSGGRKELLNEAQQIASNSRFFNRGVRSVSESKPEKSLEKILRQRQAAIVVKFQGEFILIEDIYHNN